MTGIAAFITARLDEEAAASPDMLWGETAADNDMDERRARAHRVIDGTRNILARYEDCLTRMEDPEYPAAVARDQAREYEDFVLPNIAVRWSDHPDYGPDWAA